MELLTVYETAKLLKLSTNHVYALIKQGVLPSVRVGGSIRVVRAQRELFRDSNAPYGYEVKDGKLYIRPDESPDIVKEIELLKSKKKKTLNLIVDDVISKEEYDELINDINKRIDDLSMKKQQAESSLQITDDELAIQGKRQILSTF